ncbi:MAG: DUF192 domain-containing protein [Deltaproteobacteria bacterium]|nr:DUF192 domain-containing protein [Deltaproteobacteria bacterium]
MFVGIALNVACRPQPPKAVAGESGEALGKADTSLKTVVATFISLKGAKSLFNLEVADTPALRGKGLMYRRELAPDRGMVFVFPGEEDQTFYMKNTYVPLDMVFVNSRLVVVGVVEDARPLTLVTRSVGRPSQYVIELNAHAARRHGIGPGARVDFRPKLPAVTR